MLERLKIWFFGAMPSLIIWCSIPDFTISTPIHTGKKLMRETFFIETGSHICTFAVIIKVHSPLSLSIYLGLPPFFWERHLPFLYYLLGRAADHTISCHLFSLAGWCPPSPNLEEFESKMLFDLMYVPAGFYCLYSR